MKKLLSVLTLILIIICAPVFYACGEENNEKSVTGITLNHTTYSMVAGDDVNIIATIAPNDATNKNVHFYVTDVYPYTTEDLTAVTENNSYVEFKIHERYKNYINIKIKETCVEEGSFYLNAISEDGLYEAHCVFYFYPPMRDLVEPANVHYNATNGRLEWDAVENATKYVLNLNGTEITTNFTYYSVFDANIMNRAKVKAVGETYRFNDSSYSDEVSFCVLGQVQNLAHLNGRITWDDLQYARGYVVSVDDYNTTVNKINYFVLGGLIASTGLHTIKVTPIPNEVENVFTKNLSAEISIRRLSVPSEFSFKNGKLVWKTIAEEKNNTFTITFYKENSAEILLTESGVAGLEYVFNNNLAEGSYDITIYAEGDGVKTISSSQSQINGLRRLASPVNLRVENGKIAWDDNVFATGYTLNINGTLVEYDRPNEQAFETIYGLGTIYNPIDYTISICSKGNGVNTIASKYTESIVARKLKTPTNIQINQNVITWDAVEVDVSTTVSRYNVLFENGEVYEVTTPRLTLGNEFTEGSYVFKIMATHDGCLYSDYSTTKSITKLAVVENLRVENGMIKYDAVEGATEYKIKVGTDEYVSNSANLIFKLNENYPAGEYVINVIAIGNSNQVINSNSLATPLTVCKLAKPVGFGVVDGELVFDAENNVANATGYILNANGTTIEDIEHYEISSTVNLKIKAVGDIGGEGAKYLDSDYTTAFTAKKLKPVQGLKIENGIFSFDAVEGAIKYDIVITNTIEETDVQVVEKLVDNDITVENLTFVLNKVPGVYNIVVIPYGTTGSVGQQYINNFETSNSITFRQLGVVQNFKIAQPQTVMEQLRQIPGALIWDKVPGAVSYQLFVDNVPHAFVDNEFYELDQEEFMMYIGDPSVEEGEHVYKIQAIGNGSSVINGDQSETVTATKLGEVTNIVLDVNTLRWTLPENAQKSAIYFPKNNNLIYPIENSFVVAESFGAGEYDAYVIAIPNNNTDQYSVGNYSDKFSFTKLQAPLSIKVKDGKVTWLSNLTSGGYKMHARMEKEEDSINTYISIKNADGEFDNSITQYDFAQRFEDKPGCYTISMMTIGNGNVSSNYSESVQTQVLDYPRNLRVYKGKITFQDISNIEYYEIIVKDAFGNQTTIKTTETAVALDDSFEPGTYTIKIRAVGNNSEYISSIFSPVYTAIKLEKPTNLRVENGKITFNGVENASGYTLKILPYINGAPREDLLRYEDIGYNLVYELSDDYSAGSYSIFVMANGSVDIGVYLNSDFSDIIANEIVTKLPIPDSIKMDRGLLMWNPVEHASTYHMLINQQTFVLGLQTEFGLPESMIDIDGVNQVLGAGDYTIQLKVIGDGNAINPGVYLNSDFDANEYIYKKLPKITNLKVHNGELWWDHIEGAYNGLQLVITLPGSTIKTVLLSGDSLNYAFLDSTDNTYATHAEHSAYIFALGDSERTFHSDISNELTGLQKLNVPTNLNARTEHVVDGWVEYYQNILTFDLDGSASRYRVYIDGIDSGIRNNGEKYVFANSVTEGVHEVYVQALGANTMLYPDSIDNKFLNSEYSETITITKPATPTNVAIFNGKVTWDASQYAKGYIVELYYTPDINESEYTFLRNVDVGDKTYMYLSENGYYRIRVQAYFTDSLCSSMSAPVAGDFRLYEGLGKEEDPFRIVDAQGLRNMRYNPTAYYKIMGDIDIANNEVNEVYYVPAGTINDPFVGQLDGQNHTISNLTFITPNTNYAALIGVIGQEGVAKNIVFANVNITSGNTTGIVAGINYGSIDNCHVVSGSISMVALGNVLYPKYVYMGGIVGINSVIENEDATRTAAQITNCTNAVDVVGEDFNASIVYSGGIAGFNSGYIYRSANTNALQRVKGNLAGGIAGTSEGLLEECYNMASIYAYAIESVEAEARCCAGGLVGYNQYIAFSSQASSIINCYNQGDVYAHSIYETKVPYAGGLSGYNISRIKRCYTTGLYEATTSALNSTVCGAAVIGYNQGVVEYCYYQQNNIGIIDVNGTELALTCSGKTTEYMKSQNFVLDLNYGGLTLFTYNENIYPKLVWQG